jgi:hypothetical protein
MALHFESFESKNELQELRARHCCR